MVSISIFSFYVSMFKPEKFETPNYSLGNLIEDQPFSFMEFIILINQKNVHYAFPYDESNVLTL